MKQIIFIFAILVMCLASVNLQAQENLPYKPWKEFHGDTLQYLDYNFTIRHLQYKGKKVSDVINDFELPIVYVVRGRARDGKLASLIIGLRQIRTSPSELLDYYVEVLFTTPLESLTTRGIFPPSGELTPQLYEFIKDLEVSTTGLNVYVKRKEKER